MVSYIAALGAAILFLFVSILYESVAFGMLGVGMAVLVLFSLVNLGVAMRKVQFRMEIPLGIAEEGQPVGVHLVMRNSSRFPLRKCRVKVWYRNTLAKKGKTIWLRTGEVMRGENRMEYEVSFRETGNYEFRILRVRIYDFMGLFSLGRKSYAVDHAVVLPKVWDIPVSLGEAVRNFYGDAEEYDEKRPGQDNSETFAVREYRPGDKLQSIHWKLSAKADDLMVREYSQPKACPLILLVGKSRLALTASIMFSLMDAECPHYVVWQSRSENDLIRMRVSDEESYYSALVLLMQDMQETDTKQLQEFYLEKYRGEHYLYALALDRERVRLNGSEVKVNRQDGRREMLELQL